MICHAVKSTNYSQTFPTYFLYGKIKNLNKNKRSKTYRTNRLWPVEYSITIRRGKWTMDGRAAAVAAVAAAELALISNCEIITSAYFDFCMYCLEFTTIKTRRVSEDGVTAELYNTVFNSIRTWLGRIRVFAGQ